PAARAEAPGRRTAGGRGEGGGPASAPAGALGGRGYGDAAVIFRLERLGLAEGVAREACARLAPETRRAAGIVEARGRSQRTAAYLARRGFSADSIEDAGGTSLADETVEGSHNGSSSHLF